MSKPRHAAAPPEKPRPPTALVIHGHFYQPPRENPWTDELEREPSAHPARNWNERILAECYRANAFARLYAHRDGIEAFVNNYAHLSFNVGPTLARWIERVDKTTLDRMRAGDEQQRRHLGAGGAMAQVWGHPIAPLLTPRDRRTQILWGLSDFRHRFRRTATGMWLPETAADPPTLDALIDAGLTYTILAPEQIAAVRKPGGSWTNVTRDELDTGRAYRFLHSDGSGRSLALCVFDGPVSRDLAFGEVTRDSHAFLSKMAHAAERSSVDGPRLVLAASDGELYGHHKKFADLTLAHAVTKRAAEIGITVTNLETFLKQNPATWEAELARGPQGEGTAWSCAHGLGRWQRHCGCAMGPPDSGWTQAWRGPLRAALDAVRDRAAAFYADNAGETFEDPWAARDVYGELIDAAPEKRIEHLSRACRRPERLTRPGASARVLTLLEMQRACLLMYASCGWFFDDVAGVESTLVIRQAAHALDLWKELGGRPPTELFLERLAEAQSNVPGAGTGADVFRRVRRHRTTAHHAVAAHALGRIIVSEDLPEDVRLSGFDIEPRQPAAGGAVARVRGRDSVRHRRTGVVESLEYEAKLHPSRRPSCRVGSQVLTLDALPDELRRPIALAFLRQLGTRPLVRVGECRLGLLLSRTNLGSHTETDIEARPLLLRLLARFLASTPVGHADAKTYGVITDFISSFPAGEQDGPKRMVQEWVWDALDPENASAAGVPAAARALAHQVGFDVGPQRRVEHK